MAGAIPGWLIAWVLARSLGLVGAPNLQPSTADLVNVLVGALSCSAVATVAWNTGVARLGIQTGAIWQNTVPVFAALITLVFYGLVPSAAQVLGRAVVLAGGLWMQWQKRARGGARAPGAATNFSSVTGGVPGGRSDPEPLHANGGGAHVGQLGAGQRMLAPVDGQLSGPCGDVLPQRRAAFAAEITVAEIAFNDSTAEAAEINLVLRTHFRRQLSVGIAGQMPTTKRLGTTLPAVAA